MIDKYMVYKYDYIWHNGYNAKAYKVPCPYVAFPWLARRDIGTRRT